MDYISAIWTSHLFSLIKKLIIVSLLTTYDVQFRYFS